MLLIKLRSRVDDCAGNIVAVQLLRFHWSLLCGYVIVHVAEVHCVGNVALLSSLEFIFND